MKVCSECETWTPGDVAGDGSVLVCRVCAARGKYIVLVDELATIARAELAAVKRAPVTEYHQSAAELQAAQDRNAYTERRRRLTVVKHTA